MFDLVEDGAVDASWSVYGYVPGRFKLTKSAELPNLNANTEAASVTLWRVHQKYYKQANEHEGLLVAALFTHGPGQIHLAEPTHQEFQAIIQGIDEDYLERVAAALKELREITRNYHQ